MSPTYKTSKMKMDRQRQVKLLKLKGKYPYEERNTELVPSLNNSGSQSMNGRFNTISARTHVNETPAMHSLKPIGNHED